MWLEEAKGVRKRRRRREKEIVGGAIVVSWDAQGKRTMFIYRWCCSKLEEEWIKNHIAFL